MIKHTFSLFIALMGLLSTNVAVAAEGTSCTQGVYFSEPDAYISDSGFLEIKGITSDVRCLSDSLVNHQVMMTVFASDGSSVLSGQATIIENEVKSENGSIRKTLDARFNLKALAVKGKVWMKVTIDGREYDYVKESRAATYDFNNLPTSQSENGAVRKGKWLTFSSGSGGGESQPTPVTPAPVQPPVQTPSQPAPVSSPQVSADRTAKRKAAIEQRIKSLQSQIDALKAHLNSL